MVLLSAEPTMHAHIIECIASKRQSIVTKQFLLALN